MKRFLILLLEVLLGMFCFFSLPLEGQAIPDAPTPWFHSVAPQPQLSRLDWSLLGFDAASRGLDTYSTSLELENPCNHEMFLPDAIAKHPAAMTAYSAGMVALDWYFARTLTRHGHPRLAHLVIAVDTAQNASWAIHNLTLPTAPPQGGIANDSIRIGGNHGCSR